MPNKKKGRKLKAPQVLSQEQPNLIKIKKKPLKVQSSLCLKLLLKYKCL